jgi:hypothetical protein
MGRLLPFTADENRALYLRSHLFYLAVLILLNSILIAVSLYNATITYRRLNAGEIVQTNEVDRARALLLNAPKWVILIAALGWLPAYPYFVLALGWLEVPLAAGEWRQIFFICLYCLGIIIPYTYLFQLYLAIRVIYKQAWADPSDFDQRAALELKHVTRLLTFMQSLAGIAPLAFIMTLLLLGPDYFALGGPDAQHIMLLSCVAGILGYPLAMRVGRSILLSLEAFRADSLQRS